MRRYLLLFLCACPAAKSVEESPDEMMTTDEMPPDMAATGPTMMPDEMPMDAPFGLDARPSNTSCIARPPPPDTGNLTLTNVFSGMVSASSIMHMQAQRIGGVRYWFVAYREGTVKTFRQPDDNGTSVEAGVDALDQTSVISLAGEGGLLGLALDPQFSTNGRVYVTYTVYAGQHGCPAKVSGEDEPLCLYLSRYVLTPTVDTAGVVTAWSAGTEERLSFASPTEDTGADHIRKPDSNHNGGALVFGLDGKLFIATGDGGGGGDTYDNGQNLQSVLGKILRLDVSCDNLPCALPSDNPVIAGNRTLLYAYGFRNPWRMWLDRGTGDLWVGNVGQSGWEELERVVPGGNHGWPIFEGTHLYAPTGDAAGITMPIAEYATTSGRNIASGGVVYRGSRLASYIGHVFWGDYTAASLWDLAPPFAEPRDLSNVAPLFTNAGGGTLFADEAGEMYLVVEWAGVIRRVDPQTPPPTSTFPTLLSQTGCQTTSGLVPFGVNAELWSDGLTKKRWMALPDGATVTLNGSDFDFPNGTVLVKEFSSGQTKIETRLLMKDESGTWAGYTYRWNSTQTDATLVGSSGEDVAVGSATWSLPARSQCMQCHTSAAGFALGPEVGQLNGAFVYASTNRRSNQLATLTHIGLLPEVPSPPVIPDPFGSEGLEARAKAYLHANCANCHRPGGPSPADAIDLRFTTSLATMGICNVDPARGDTGISDMPKLFAPTAPGRSVLVNRMQSPAFRMPLLGTRVVHDAAVSLVSSWVSATQSCP